MRCFYCFFGSITYTVRKKVSDKHGLILIIEALIEDTEFTLIHLYTANTANDQLTNYFLGTEKLFRKLRSYLK